VDETTNNVYGHVVGSDPFGHAYVVPLAHVLVQVADCFSGLPAPPELAPSDGLKRTSSNVARMGARDTTLDYPEPSDVMHDVQRAALGTPPLTETNLWLWQKIQESTSANRPNELGLNHLSEDHLESFSSIAVGPPSTTRSTALSVKTQDASERYQWVDSWLPETRTASDGVSWFSLANHGPHRNSGSMTLSSSNEIASHALEAGSNSKTTPDQPREPSEQLLARLTQPLTTDGSPHQRFDNQPETAGLQGRIAFHTARAQGAAVRRLPRLHIRPRTFSHARGFSVSTTHRDSEQFSTLASTYADKSGVPDQVYTHPGTNYPRHISSSYDDDPLHIFSGSEASSPARYAKELDDADLWDGSTATDQSMEERDVWGLEWPFSDMGAARGLQEEREYL
jgi:hypothetical protein